MYIDRDEIMKQFNVKGRYVDRQGRSHNFKLALYV